MEAEEEGWEEVEEEAVGSLAEAEEWVGRSVALRLMAVYMTLIWSVHRSSRAEEVEELVISVAKS